MQINPPESCPCEGPHDGNNITTQLEKLAEGHQRFLTLWKERPPVVDLLLCYLSSDEFNRIHISIVAHRHDMSPLRDYQIQEIVTHFGISWEAQKNVAYPTYHLILRGLPYVVTIHTPYSNREDLAKALFNSQD